MGLKQIRKEKGFSQQELAKGLGVTQGTIQKIESGKNDLTLKMMKKLSEFLNIEPWQLLPKDMQPSVYHDLALEIDYSTMVYNEALELYKQNKKVMDLILQQAKVTNRLLEKYNQLRERENVKEV